MKILVLGAGAIGAYYGGRLSQSGVSVSVIARSDYDIVSSAGYNIKSIHGDFIFTPHSVFRTPEQAGSDWDIILVALKVLPTIDTVRLLQPLVGRESAIFLLQNGINIEEPIAQAFPQHTLISGLAFMCVSRTAPGHITHQDYGHLSIGDYEAAPSEKTQSLARLFEKGGVQCRVDEDIQHARWMKLCWNAPYNPLSVIGGGINTTQIMEHALMRQLVTDVMHEVMALSRADGHAFDETHIQNQLLVTDRMKAYKPSMLLDYEAGRPMEVEAILGNAVRSGQELGVEIPRIRSLYALLSVIDEYNQ